MLKKSIILLISAVFFSSCATMSIYQSWNENRVDLIEGIQKTTYLETLHVTGKKEYSLPELITFSEQKFGEGVVVQNVRKEIVTKIFRGNPFGNPTLFSYTWDVVKID